LCEFNKPFVAWINAGNRSNNWFFACPNEELFRVTSTSTTPHSRKRLIPAGRDYVLLPRRRDGVRATEQHGTQAQVLAWAPGWNAGHC
jgi:hypothetical protein